MPTSEAEWCLDEGEAQRRNPQPYRSPRELRSSRPKSRREKDASLRSNPSRPTDHADPALRQSAVYGVSPRSSYLQHASAPVVLDSGDYSGRPKLYPDTLPYSSRESPTADGAGLPLRAPLATPQLPAKPVAPSHTHRRSVDNTLGIFMSKSQVEKPLVRVPPKKALQPKITISSDEVLELTDSDKSHGFEQKSNHTEVYDKFYTPQNRLFYSKSPYTPLNPTREEIRVVKVFPRKPLLEHFDDHPDWDRSHVSGVDSSLQLLACQIEKTALPRIDGHYSTLSYCAGDLQNTELMLVNGIPFNAFMNLGHAIECVLNHWPSTNKDSGCMLWLDQICINQSDKKELGQQVQFMREIYRRSEQTFVCLSTPKALECLSWIPRVPGHSARASAAPGSDTRGVIALKNLLLDFSVGKGLGGDLRPSEPETSPMLGSDFGTDPKTHCLTESLSELAGDRNPFSRTSSGTSRVSSSSIRSSRHTIEGLESRSSPSASNTRYMPSADVFQSSLWEFMTNKWWRRSWVYQEFLSGQSIHFVSGSTSVPWSELAPFVQFVCYDLDPFMESIRVYFESMITEDMKAKERERLKKERERKTQAERLRLEAIEAHRREELKTKRREEERRRKEQEEKYRRSFEQDMSRRILEAEKDRERDAELAHQQRLQEYNFQLTAFENERLRQWNHAREEQHRKREEYAAQQRLAVQQEMTELWNRQAALKRRKLSTRMMLHREEKVPKNFLKDVDKPIDDQIKDAFNFQHSYSTEEDSKIDKQCGGRHFATPRIEMLLALDKVPKGPQEFVPTGISRPVPPEKAATPRKYRANQQYVMTSPAIPEIAELESPLKAPWSPQPLIPRASELETPFSVPRRPLKHPALTTRRSISQFSYLLDDEKSSSEDEQFKRRVKERKVEDEPDVGVTLKKLGASEIQQRDNITSLQTKFRQLDRSVIASMAKGKQTFKRSSDLKALLQHSRNCEASDQRDRVYAFLGLAHDGYGIIPDYTANQDIKKVLIEAAKGIIRFDKSLDILRHVHRGRDKLGLQLPTWVPDWTSEETKTGLDQCSWDETRPFDAAKGVPADVEFGSDGHEDLRVRGIFVDSILDTESESSDMDEVFRFSTTQGDRVIGPKSARSDDEIWVLYGSTRPVVLRRNGKSHYGYLGDVLIYAKESGTFSELMFGQMVDRIQQGTLDRAQERTIWIV